jgi:hypothetical protein
MGFSFSSRMVWKRRRIARSDHAEEGGWKPVALLDKQRAERSKLGMTWDSAYPPKKVYSGDSAMNTRGGVTRPELLKTAIHS